MSLSGNLSFVPIDEVLRLLTRSKQQGSVDVTGNGIYGRVFIGERGIDLATSYDDDDLHRHLVNSGFADESSLRRITTGETTLAALADSNVAMIELIREMTVESLYQIAARGEDFEVREGVTTPYASPNSFELEKLLGDATAREKDWAKVSEVVPDLTGAISFRRDLGEREEVTVKTDDWKVLSEIGEGASVSQIADRLGTTEFWAAQITSRLVKNDLIDIDTSSYQVAGTEEASKASQADDDIADDAVAGSTETDEVAPPSWDTPTVEEEDDVSDDAMSDSGYDDATAESAEPAATDQEVVSDEEPEPISVADTDPNESWWQEPTEEAGSQAADEDAEPAVVAEGLSEIPAVSSDGSDVEEDTEAFLEKVFSELESAPEDEGQEGHGLLRRRRMGTLRDFSSDS